MDNIRLEQWKGAHIIDILHKMHEHLTTKQLPVNS